jgi:phage-related minor tail protein
MILFTDIIGSRKDLITQITDQKKAEALQKEKEAIQSRLDTLESSLAKFKDNAVTPTNTIAPAVVEAPTPAKSKTLMYVGIVAGGIVVTYLLLKFSKKE